MHGREIMKVNSLLKSNTYKMKKAPLYILSFLTGLLLLAGPAAAQRISFGLYASDGITLTPLGLGELNFNEKQTLILAGNTVQFLLTDEAIAIIAIEGRADLDVTITIDADPTLMLDTENEIPLSIGFAYSNLGAGTEEIARTQAIQVPPGFTSTTFPLKRRTAGPPGPPPTPAHTGYIQPTGMAYLFIYGTLGPVPADAATGVYLGNINVYVTYSTFN
jgi:hypothetical protein